MTAGPGIHTTAALHAAARRETEATLAAAVLCDPARGVPLAEKHGATPDLFANEDLRLIFLACVMAPGRTREAAEALAFKGLRFHGYEDPEASGDGPGWSAASLSIFAEAWFHSPLLIIANARKLVDADAREAEAAELLRRAEDILTLWVEPTPTNRRLMVCNQRRVAI